VGFRVRPAGPAAPFSDLKAASGLHLPAADCGAVHICAAAMAVRENSFYSVFKRKPCPDMIRDGSRFASSSSLREQA
jgi:hypothetical protein